MSIESVMI